jgi:hypothetical protein
MAGIGLIGVAAAGVASPGPALLTQDGPRRDDEGRSASPGAEPFDPAPEKGYENPTPRRL